MEMMRARILVYLCAFLSCDVHTHTATLKDSSEQSALQEALLLVELLKSEYARVLRGNNLITDHVDEKDLRTCATTTVPTDAVTYTKPVQHIERSSTRQTLKPYTTHGSNRFHYSSNSTRNRPRGGRRSKQDSRSYYYDFPRRRFNGYRDYGIYGPAESWRRMDYENVFGPQPGQSNSTVGRPTTTSVTNSETLTLSSTSTTLSTTVSETPISSISNTLSQMSSSSTTFSSTTVSSATPDTVTPSESTLKPTEPSLPTILSSTLLQVLKSSTTPSTTHAIKRQPTLIPKPIASVSTSVKRLTNIITQTKNPLVPENLKLKQKTQKLLLSVEKTTVTTTNDPEQAQVAAELENELQAGIEPSTSSRRWSVTWRPSTRVHLARSTPYHLPLPENHAFCYTNPESSLCRTFIK